MAIRFSRALSAVALATAGTAIAVASSPVCAEAAPVTTQLIPDGAYTLTESGSDDVMSVKSDSEANLATMRLTYDNGGLSQRFHFRYESKYNAYSIVNFRSLKAVGIQDGKMSLGTPINQFTYSEWEGQLWNVVKSGSYYVLQAKGNPSMYIGKNNTQLVLASTPVQWKLTEFKTGKVLENGQYLIQKPSHNRVLDIKDGSGAEGALAQLYRYNTSKAQMFEFTFNPTDATYTITNVNSGKALDRKDNADQATVWQKPSNNTDAQKWRVYRDPRTGKFAILNAKSRFGLYSEAIPKIYDTDNQSESSHGAAIKTGKPDLWSIVSAEDYELPDGTYSIYSSKGIVTNKYKKTAVSYQQTRGYMSIDVKSASKKNRANIQLYDANTTLAQKFIFKSIGNGYYTITNVASGKVLDVANASHKNGANIWQYDGNGSYAQQWKVEFDERGYVTLRSRLTGRAIDVTNGNCVRSTNIRCWNFNGTAAQKWIVTDAPTATSSKTLYMR